MNTLDLLFSVIAPHQCLGCTAEGTLLCKKCAASLPRAQPACYSCLMPTKGSLTCSTCLPLAPLRAVYTAHNYNGAVKQLVLKLKFGSAQAAVGPISRSIAAVVPKGPFVIVPVPTATRRARQRGYDQAVLIARRLAGRQVLRLPYVSCLHRVGQAHQVGADRSQRLQQLTGAFYVARPARVRGKQILLIDDIVTTGATFQAAARVLMDAGAASVSAAAFARPAVSRPLPRTYPEKTHTTFYDVTQRLQK